MLNCSNFVFSEELPQKGYRWDFNMYHNPIYYKYIDDYINQLGEAFEHTAYRRNHMGASYEYVIEKDGTIRDLKLDLYDNKKMAATVKNIILNNPPPPFYEGMNEKEINVSTFLGRENYEDYDFDYYPKKGQFSINIIIKR